MLKFNPSKLAATRRLAAFAALTLAAATTGCYSTHEAIGQDNGALSSNSYLSVSYAPASTFDSTDRHPRVTDPHIPAAVNQHMYPPIAR